MVIDTNVLLDWLVFHDPSTRALDHAIRSGARQWVATLAMRDELQRVLTRRDLPPSQSSGRFSLVAWDAFAQIVAPARPVSPSAMRCTDPDDQKFIDLALQLGAVLLSRDRAVLRLARPGRARGIDITTAAAWAESIAAPPAISG